METGYIDLHATPPPAPRVGIGHYILAFLAALLGGVLGIPSAILAEVRLVFAPSLFFLAPPIAEEILKPIGIYFYIARWPHVLRSQLAIAGLAALSGITFGIIESTVYVTVYAPGLSRWYFLYRFTVTVLVHATASFIAGLGINRELIGWAKRENSLPRASREAFIAAMALHLLYNVTAVALEVAGVLDFD